MNKQIKNISKIVSCECEYKYDGRKCNLNQKSNSDKCRCECKKCHICEKDYIWNPATYGRKNGKYLARIIDYSVITCDEFIDEEAQSYDEETKITTRNLNEKNIVCETKKVICFTCFFIYYYSIIDSC